MATSTSAKQFTARINKTADAVRKARRTSVERACYAAKDVHLHVLRQDVPSLRIRNAGRNGARVGVVYDVKGEDRPAGVVKMTGPVHLINNPAQPHLIIASGLGTGSTRTRVSRAVDARAAFGGSLRGTFQGSQRTQIGSKKAIAQGRGRKAAHALTLPGGKEGLRGYASHPGHAGKHTFQRATPRAHTAALKELNNTMIRAVRDVAKAAS